MKTKNDVKTTDNDAVVEYDTTDEIQEKITDFSIFELKYDHYNVSFGYQVAKDSFDGIAKEDFIKYLKMVFTNKERFMERFFKKIADGPNKDINCEGWDLNNISDWLVNNYDDAIIFNYAEAFSIVDERFRAKVFSAINVGEMVENLGHERIATDGIITKNKKFSPSGEFLGFDEYHNIYETHKLSGEKLGLGDVPLYALKCWCTSTNKEHWLWIGSKFKDDPLNAIASTFFVYKNLLPYIKEFKRHGDILLQELTEDIKPEGELVALTKEQYFGKLTAQS